MPDVADLVVRVTADIKDAEAGLRRAKAAVNDFAKGAAGAGGDGAQSKVKDLHAAFDRFGSGMKNVGRDLALHVSAPIAAVGALAIKTAADYEQSLSVLQEVTKATSGEMRAFDELAIKLGADINLPTTSAKDAAAAMLELSKAGLSVQDTMGATRGVLELAAAAQISNAKAAEIAASALVAFRLPGTDATRFANGLAGAAAASLGSISDMGFALRQSAAVAKMAGIPFEDLMAAITMMANAGIKGSDAGTSLKTMILKLIAPSKEMVALAETWGIKLRDAQGNLRPLGTLIDEFTRKAALMPKALRDADLKDAFGTDAIRGAFNVLLGGLPAFEKAKAAVTDMTAAKRMAESQTKGFNGAIGALKSSLETLALSARPWLTTLAGIVRDMAGFVNRLNELPQPAKNAIAVFALAAAAVGPLLLAFGHLTTITVGVIANWGTLATVGGAVVGFLTGPWGVALAAGVAAVVALGLAWSQNWGGIRTTVEQAIAFIRPYLAQAWAAIKEQALPVWNEIRRVLIEVWPPIRAAIQLAVQGITTNLTRAWTTIRELTQGTWSAVRQVIVAVLNIITGTVKQWVAGLILAIEVPLKVLQGDWAGAWEAIKRAFVLFADGHKQATKGWIDALQGIFKGAIQVFANLGELMLKGLAEGILKGQSAVINALRDVLNGAVATGKQILGIKSPSRVFEELGQNVAAGYMRGMESGRGAVRDSLASLMTGAQGPRFSFAGAGGGGGGFVGPPARGSGGGGGAPAAAVVLHQTINIMTPDVESFRQSQTQIAQDLGRAARYALRDR